jgi:hypothetical protein
MFIEYEIKENDELCTSVINVRHIVVLEATENELVIFMSTNTIRFFLDERSNWLLYDAFKRALCGESVTIEGIGYVRPLKPAENHTQPSIAPIKSMTWRNYP